MKRAPEVKFRAGDRGWIHNNVNFARSEAEEIANKTGKPVSVYQLVNHKVALTLQVMSPSKDPP